MVIITPVAKSNILNRLPQSIYPIGLELDQLDAVYICDKRGQHQMLMAQSWGE